MRRLIALIIALGALVASAAPAIAADGKLDDLKKVEQDDQGDVVLTVEADGSVTQPSSNGSGKALVCDLYEHAPSFESPAENPPLAGADLVEGQYYWLTCHEEGSEALVVARLFVYEPGEPAISPDELARRAQSQLAILYPQPRTSPGIGIDQIVGIDTWMWIDAGDWEPVTATAGIPGLSVTATATPTQVSWDMGDGTTVTCDGPGTPYDSDLEPSDQSTDCSHVYQRRGAHTASATVVWAVEWTASDGSGGVLASASRTTEFPMSVVERQAIGR